MSSISPSGRVRPIQAFCCGRTDGSSNRGRARFQAARSSALSSTGGLTPGRRVSVRRSAALCSADAAVRRRPSHDSGRDAEIHRVVHRLCTTRSRRPRVRRRYHRVAPRVWATRCGEPTSAAGAATIGTGVSPTRTRHGMPADRFAAAAEFDLRTRAIRTVDGSARYCRPARSPAPLRAAARCPPVPTCRGRPDSMESEP